MTKSFDDLVAGKTFDYIIGIDEVGWGAIAGPVGVGCVVLPADFDNTELQWKDSKKYSSEIRREEVATQICQLSCDYQVEFIDNGEIAACGSAGVALRRTMTRMALKALRSFPNAIVVIDGNQALPGVPEHKQISLIKADAIVPAVSAASIIAKDARDTSMLLYAKQYPGYGFANNKGYPTKQHLAAMKALGVIRIHRTHSRPVSNILKEKKDGSKAA